KVACTVEGWAPASPAILPTRKDRPSITLRRSDRVGKGGTGAGHQLKRSKPPLPALLIVGGAVGSVGARYAARGVRPLQPARTSRPGSAPVCSPRSKIGVPATSVAS